MRYAARTMALFPIQLPSGHGLVDREGRVVVAPTLRQIGPFSEGLAAATLAHGKTGFLDETGVMRIEPRFGSTTRFAEGLCAVVNEAGKQAFIDTTGREVIVLDEPQRFFEELVFSEGRCRTTKNGWSGYIDREGRVVASAARTS